jgi:hypothetical protein
MASRRLAFFVGKQREGEMKSTDAYVTDMHALLAHMDTDVRFTEDEQAALVAIHAVIAAGADTTKDQDMVIVKCLEKLVCQSENYMV